LRVAFDFVDAAPVQEFGRVGLCELLPETKAVALADDVPGIAEKFEGRSVSVSTRLRLKPFCVGYDQSRFRHDMPRPRFKRGDVIERLDEIAEAVLPEGDVEPQEESPTEDSS